MQVVPSSSLGTPKIGYQPHRNLPRQELTSLNMFIKFHNVILDLKADLIT